METWVICGGKCEQSGKSTLAYRRLTNNALAG